MKIELLSEPYEYYNYQHCSKDVYFALKNAELLKPIHRITNDDGSIQYEFCYVAVFREGDSFYQVYRENDDFSDKKYVRYAIHLKEGHEFFQPDI